MDYALIGQGKADPYISITFGTVKLKSQVKKDTLEPTWNQKLFIPTQSPTINDKIFLKLKDEDIGGINETIGSHVIKFKDIVEGQYKRPFWVNFYGAWADTEDKKVKDQMNTISELGSRFKGRALMEISIKDCDKPVYGTFSLKPEDYFTAPEPLKLKAILDIHYVSNI
jgi:C2 domain